MNRGSEIKWPATLPTVLSLMTFVGCGSQSLDTNMQGTGGRATTSTVTISADAAGVPDAALKPDTSGGTSGTGGAVKGDTTGPGGTTGTGGSGGSGGSLKADAMGAGGTTGMGGTLGAGGATYSNPDSAAAKDALGTETGAAMDSLGGNLDSGADLPLAPPRPDGSSVGVDPCNPSQPSGTHTVHFRYIWAGAKTFTYFPKPESMPQSIQLEVGSNKVTCARETDRPWFACPIPDSYFAVGATWRALDASHTPEWNTVASRPFPSLPKDYWVRWYYGKPNVPRADDPPNFMFYDYYPDGSHGNWAATGTWNDSQCAAKPPANPVQVGFDYGGWFPYRSTQYKYPFGGSLAYVYSDVATVQDAFNAFVFERYQIWKRNYIKYDTDACGTGTARVATDPPETVSEGQGYGIAMSAAVGDKDLFDKLWNFTRHYLSQNAKKYCGGLMGWMWQGMSSCRPLDQPCDPATEGCSGIGDSAFDGDVDIAIGLVYAALQWPEYQQYAVDWLVKMECEINTAYDGKWNYPSTGDVNDKTCQNYPSRSCFYAPGSPSQVRLDYYPPGYFRVFGDFLAAKLGSTAQASNGQPHRDFWYKTAETVYQMLEMCYDQPGVNPGLVGASGTVKNPCSAPTEGTYEELRSLWRVAVDGAWFGDNVTLPENAANSSPHYSSKSRMQAKIDNGQDFFNNFYKKNPVEPNANRFSSICDSLSGDGTVTHCDPSLGHNAYTVSMAMCNYTTLFDSGGATTSDIRREAIEEAITTTVENERYYQESLGVYSLLFLTGNFPNPMAVPAN